MSVQIKSVLHELIAKLDNIQDLEAAKTISVEYIKGTQIKDQDQDKRKMLMVIQHQTRDIQAFYRYLYNSLLKYEGLGTVGRKEF